MRQESTSGGEKQASGAGAKKGWRRIVSLAGPAAVGAAGLAAAAVGGYLEGEKVGAARAVAHELFTREHRELREVQGGIELVRQRLYRLHAEERRASEELARAEKESSRQHEGAAPSQGASANAEHGAAPPNLPQTTVTEGAP
ncbi:MAG TPA: hypothetical protein PLU30_23520 [Verrucomicrobiae bacterium]|nr:hypothetical protein [Verrucomicrobiae bacterium]